MALVHRKLKSSDNKSATDTWGEHRLGSSEMNMRTNSDRDGRTQDKVEK